MPRWTFCTSPAKVYRVMVGQRRQQAKEDRHAPEQRQRPVALGLGPPKLLELGEPVRVLRG